MSVNTKWRGFFCLCILVFLSACSTSTTSSRDSNSKSEIAGISPNFMAPHEAGKKQSGKVDLDSKALSRIIKGYQAIIQNDDKRAKLSYGRAHKYMPAFLQFAYDLRFRNFERAQEVVSRLPYSSEEKEFWLQLVNKKPTIISKYVCDWFKENKFNFKSQEADAAESLWFSEYVATANDLQAKYFVKAPAVKMELDLVFEKYMFVNLKRETVALSPAAQKELLTDAFFDKFRNMQRRDTSFYNLNFRNTYNTLTRTPYFKAQNAWDFYQSLEITDHPRKNHYLRRLKGIIKDMRQNMIFFRVVGSKLIQDKEDYNKALSLGYFITRYPLISSFLRFDFSLNDCGYSPIRE